MPGSLLSRYAPVPARSVPFCCVTRYCSGESSWIASSLLVNFRIFSSSEMNEMNRAIVMGGPSALDQTGHDIDVAVYRLGVREPAMCTFDQFLGRLTVDTRQTDIQSCLKGVLSIGNAQVNFGV